MASQRQRQVLSLDTDTIVSNAYAFDPTFVDLNGDDRCPGIKSIFQELLNDRGWTLNHLPCRYLVGESIVELFYFPERHQPDSGMIKT